MKLLDFWIWLGFCLLFFFFFSFTNSFSDTSFGASQFVPENGGALELEPQNHIEYKYDRLDEVRKECRSILSSASELVPENYINDRIRNGFSFVNGDWVQESDAAAAAPLLPFDDSDMPKSSSNIQSPLKLISFWVTDVDSAHRTKKSVAISGMLFMGITRNSSFGYQLYGSNPQFQMYPGNTQLTIFFQGVYVETKANGGEISLCLLGNAVLPSRQSDSSDPWEWVKATPFNQPPLLQDDQILLVLHYPKSFTLSSRAIRGEMRSLNPESNLKYFDKLHISSQFGAAANYEFGSEALVSNACEPYPYPDNSLGNGINIYKGPRFCEILQRFTSSDAFKVVPNWKCNNTDEYCSKLGPFATGKEIQATDGGFNNVRLVMQDVRCEAKYEHKNSSSAKVSTVFRVVTPFENKFTAIERTGLSNLTLRAEGIWNSSSGKLCMIGCLGPEGNDSNICNSRICLYIPLTFSISHQNIIFGTISSISNSTDSYFPLPFERQMISSELWDRFGTSFLSYKYTKIDSASAFLDRSEPFDFRAVIKKSLLSYPALEDGITFLDSLSRLSEDLDLQVSAFDDASANFRQTRTFIQVEILSLGPCFGRYWSNVSGVDREVPYHAKAESTETQLLLNVSAQLSLSGEPYRNISMMSLEGLYDSRVGKMYLIGCRDVRASWKILFDSSDLEDGLDCLIEVKLEYPPKTARWLINPTAKISISSHRTEDDPLYFNPVNLQTVPILYRRQREDILSRRGVEGILRILTLSLAIACILCQLLDIRDKADVVPFMSLVMLGVQGLGYSLPLITGAEAIFKRMSSENDETASYDLEKGQWFHIVDYTVKLLVLVAFLLTLRLSQKVWKSRIRLLTHTPLEPGRVPNDKRVFFVSLVIHTAGFILVLIFHAVNTGARPAQSGRFVDPNGKTYQQREWEIKLEEYVGLVQDFFLLPQIIGNLLWQIHCKPLRKLYYVGITLVRLLPHVYDYKRAPVFNPYFSEEYEFVNPNLDFFSRFGDIAIPVTAIVLAAVVFIQQRWTYQKIAEAVNRGGFKLLPTGSRVYERLPSKSSEAELVSVVKETVPLATIREDYAE
ncbi:hypothetical protein C5167_025765 [Papaver somniferum]|uniref:RING-type E3 ubiquitin transferase n=1 Tax=Papaver somniferum TaxID=3469 RepID=A0A4Y7JW67_PAPSO|nr:uncharacterized protein LOC113284485 isoform X1 [Papaver somniferum]RZC64008.1 hypothetical protein C5167_025765 [Papaver somniferum]